MDFFTILIIIAVVAKIIDGMRGGTKPQQRPGTQRRVPDASGRQGLPGAEPAARRRSTEDTAADMVPDELWEILTGQKRQPPAVPPSLPAPAPAETLPARWQEEETIERSPAPVVVRQPRDEEAEIDAFLKRQRKSLARRDRPQPKAVIKSLETEPLPELARHRAFHDRKLAAPATVTAYATGDLIRRGLTGKDLRRAIILKEVLGTPKGLE